MRDEAQKRIGHLYPKITVTEAMARDRKDLKDYIGQELTVIAWLWARTVPSPNPAAGGAHVPLVGSFWLSTKEGKQAWVEPVILPGSKEYKFVVKTGTPTDKAAIARGTKTARATFACLFTGAPIGGAYADAAANAGTMSSVPMAIVAIGTRGRIYLSPDAQDVRASVANAEASLDRAKCPTEPARGTFAGNAQGRIYGFKTFQDYFTPRQLVALTTFSDLVTEARARVLADARSAGLALAEGTAKGGITGTEAISAGTKGVFAGAKTPSAGTETISAGTKTVFAGTNVPSAGTKTVFAGTKTPLAGTRTPSVGTNGGSEGTPATENGVSEATDGAERYADAVATYLGMALSKLADASTSLTRWKSSMDQVIATFGRQAIPMVWDFAESNVFNGFAGDFQTTLVTMIRAISNLPMGLAGGAQQVDAASSRPLAADRDILYSTDPPYYDNIGYADLSDFFYVWLRRSLGSIYPSLFRTLLTPKVEELIASPYRHEGSKDKAMSFFETGLGRAFERMREAEHPDYPLTVFYAFKQAESDDGDEEEDSDSSSSTASTGWETMLEGLIKAGFAITGTWPMRTELGNRMVGMGANALASSIVLVCHARGDAAPMASRREFVTALKRELPAALRDLQSGNIAPVDLAQAAIGPGMAVFSRYAKVLETSGDRMGVRTALALINQVLDEVLAEQEGEYDADTRWCIKWFEQFAHAEGPYGDAETLSKAMAVGIDGLRETGVVAAKGGKVRLFKRTELMGGKPQDWDPATDDDILHWEVCQYLGRALETGGESAAADLLRRINAVYAGATDVARDLAYRLYSICERKKWASEATSYNALIVAWPEIQKLAAKGPAAAPDSGLFAGRTEG